MQACSSLRELFKYTEYALSQSFVLSSESFRSPNECSTGKITGWEGKMLREGHGGGVWTGNSALKPWDSNLEEESSPGLSLCMVLAQSPGLGL